MLIWVSDKNGQFPLNIALAHGSIDIAMLILGLLGSTGARGLREADFEGRTPLELARMAGYEDIANSLDATGSDWAGRDMETHADGDTIRYDFIDPTAFVSNGCGCVARCP